MTEKRLAPLFRTQFLSACNDNFLKNALIFLIMFQLPAARAQSLVTLANGLFILPFFLLSGLGGEIAERFDEARAAQRLKLSKFAAAALAVAGFTLHSTPLLFVALVLFDMVSALFGPIKYGILPDHLQLMELPAGNALIEGATFIGILIGTMAGGIIARQGGDLAQFAVATILVSVLSYGASLLIPPTGPAAPELVVDADIFLSTRHLLADLWADRNLWRSGVIALSLLPPTVKMQLGGEELAVSLFLALFGVAIALGSGLGGYYCRNGISLAPTPAATLIIGLSAVDLAWTLHGLPPAPTAQSLAEFAGSLIVLRVGVDLAVMAKARACLRRQAFRRRRPGRRWKNGRGSSPR